MNENTVPLKILKKILEKNPSVSWSSLKSKIKILEPYWGQKIGSRSRLKKEIIIEKVDGKEDFAEFYGILLGDGCIYSNLSGFCISGNSELDRHYLEVYVSDLIYRLFKLRPKIYYSPKGKIMRCVLYNRAISRFLIEKGFPKGNKKSNKIRIPPVFFKRDYLIKACIRGLNDTDGSVYPQKNSKIILDISIKIKSLLESCIEAFHKISFPINYTHNRIYLCGGGKVSLFIREIGSSNLRNIKKYDMFLKEDRVPTSLETERLLKMEKNSEIELPYYGPVV